MTLQILIDEISSNLKKIFVKQDWPDVSFVVEQAKSGFGDVMCNVSFLLAKSLKENPSKISEQISNLYKINSDEIVTKVESHPSGYLNFYANKTKLNQIILSASVQENYGSLDLGNHTSIVIEHTSVNPNKALHIGHLRNIVIGDVLGRILRSTNHDVKILNYVDDSGLQVADIVVGFKHLGFSESSGEQKFDEYCGDEVYVKTTAAYETDPKLEDIRKKTLQEIENTNSETSKFASKITKKVLSEQLKTSWRLGVFYDCLNFESQIIRSGLWNQIFEKLKDLKLIKFEKDGKNTDCWVIETQNKDDDKVIVRSNGTATYIAKDIPYAAWKLGLIDDPFFYVKYQDQENNQVLWQTTLENESDKKINFTGEKVITVIDSRQSRLQQIISTLMAQFKSKQNSYLHLSYQSVVISPDTAKTLGIDTHGKKSQMSGRSGLSVNADSIIDLLEEKTFNETKKRNVDLSDDLIKKIAHDVAIGTIRYEMIKQDLDRIITFDFKKSLSLEGDTAPYIQYTFARASRILEKSKFSIDNDISFELLDGNYEQNLVKSIGSFDKHIRDAVNNYSPKVIARYCFDLAVSFNGFYEHVHVLSNENEQLTTSRLYLVYCFQSTLEKALNLLGITAPYRM